MAKKKKNKAGLVAAGIFALLLMSGKKSGGGSGTGSGNSTASTGGILSKYYTISEVQHSDRAEAENITAQFAELPMTVKRDVNAFIKIVLDPLTNYLGHKLDIESWWRSDELNELVGGVNDSYHRKGVAIDFKYNPSGIVDNKKVIQMMYQKQIPFTELVLYGSKTAPKSLHLAFDYTKPVEKEVLFKKPDGTYETLSKEFVYQTFLS